MPAAEGNRFSCSSSSSSSATNGDGSARKVIVIAGANECSSGLYFYSNIGRVCIILKIRSTSYQVLVYFYAAVFCSNGGYNLQHRMIVPPVVSYHAHAHTSNGGCNVSYQYRRTSYYAIYDRETRVESCS